MLGAFICLREPRGAEIGDLGTLKVARSASTVRFCGEGDHVTLFLGVLDNGLLNLDNPEALTGVLRIPFKGLLTGLCLLGVFTARASLPGDFKGLAFTELPSPEGPAAGLSVTIVTGILDDSGVLGVCGVLGDKFLPRWLGDFNGVLFGLSKTLESVDNRDLVVRASPNWSLELTGE